MTRIFLLVAALLAGTCTFGKPAWPDDLWLGRGGFWTSRVPVTIENGTDVAWSGKPVAVRVGTDAGQLPVAGTRIEELRLVNGDGVQLLFGVWTAGRKQPMTEGPIPADAEIVIPADCAARSRATLYFYFGNPLAWGLADTWTKRASTPVASAGSLERLKVNEIGADAPWVRSENGASAWTYRVPVRVANFSDTPRTAVLASISLPEALHATRDPEYILIRDGKEAAVCSLGKHLLFTADLPARSVVVYYLYVRRGRAGTSRPVRAVKSALGSDIPSDQIVVPDLTVSDASAFEKILCGPANLLRNGMFETAGTPPPGWTRSEARHGVTFSVSEKGGRFGPHFAMMSVPPTAPNSWIGWYQNVPVKDGHRYFFGAFVSGDHLSQSVRIHAHARNARGAVVQRGFFSTGGHVTGTVPWTPLFDSVQIPDGATVLQIHLTMNGSGLVAHDGALVAEYSPAFIGDPEAAPSVEKDPELAVAAIDPVIKVFRETPVTDDRSGFKIALAQNETEPLQLAVRSVRALPELEAVVTPPTNGVFSLDITVGRVGYVPIDHPTAYYSCRTPAWHLKYPLTSGQSDGWSGWWPDPIIPSAKGPVTANVTQPYWINVKAKGTARPGLYTGRILWKTGDRVLREDVYQVTVWNFAIPERPEFPAIYDVRNCNAYRLPGETHDAARDRIWSFMAEKKICPNGIGISIPFVRGADGQITADFTKYDALAVRYFDTLKFPTSYMPDVFYCFGWAMPPKKFLGEDPYEGKWPYEGADRLKLRPEYKAAYQAALRLYRNHVKSKGWAERLTLYISDEPHFSRPEIRDQMKALCTMIHEVDPKIRIYCSTWRHCPEWNESLDVWGVGHYGCFPVAEMSARAAVGKEIWFTTDGQMCTDTPYCAVERLLPHYCHAWKAQAYEFWGCTWLTYNPWKYGWHRYIRQSDTPGQEYSVRYPAGDGFLIYPPEKGVCDGLASSIRLEAARDGVEDYAYLKLLAACAADTARPARAKEASALLAAFKVLVPIPNEGGRYSSHILPNPEELGALRFRAGTLLSR